MFFLDVFIEKSPHSFKHEIIVRLTDIEIKSVNSCTKRAYGFAAAAMACAPGGRTTS